MPNYGFVQNQKCEYFPCHKGVKEEDFNCLFCYCPLYALGKDCGGCFVYLENGIKDCSACAFPHRKENLEKVQDRIIDIIDMVKCKENTL